MFISEQFLTEVEKDEKVDPELEKELIAFFTKNPSANDEQVHAFAEEKNMDPHEFEEQIYHLLGKLLNNIGKHKSVTADKFDPEQIKMGMEVEKEHTDDPALTVEIAKDHLTEIPDYYTRLKKMEDEAKKQQGKTGD
jgi:hypothetical protein